MAVIDLAFLISGKAIPVDHGYGLFSAVCRVIPGLHGDPHVGIHPISGKDFSNGLISVGTRSRLRVRMPSESIAAYLALAGCELDIDGHLVTVGVPRVEALSPVTNLAARLVTFKGMMAPNTFEECARRHLREMCIEAEPVLVPGSRPRYEGLPLRRVFRIKGRRIVGYAIRVLGLTADESIRLQEHGLGGRRRMGCGVFVPMP